MEFDYTRLGHRGEGKVRHTISGRVDLTVSDTPVAVLATLPILVCLVELGWTKHRRGGDKGSRCREGRLGEAGVTVREEGRRYATMMLLTGVKGLGSTGVDGPSV